MKRSAGHLFPPHNTIHIKVEGNSMYPILQNRDKLTVQKTPLSRLRVNDIILFWHNRYIVHRVIYKKGKCIYTKGDNSTKCDKPLKSAYVFGKVIKLKRNHREHNISDLYLFQSHIYKNEILKINKCFNDNDLRFVFLKGPPLYNMLGLQHRYLFYDCDVLINNNQFVKAESLLTRLGYHIRKNVSFVSTAVQNKLEITYEKQVKGITVRFDLHAQASFLTNSLPVIQNWYPVDTLNKLSDYFLKTSKKILYEAHLVPILSPLGLVVYLNLHLFHHNNRGWRRLFTLNSAVQKLNSSQNAIDAFINIISRFGLENYIYTSILSLDRTYPSTFSNRIKKRLKTATLPNFKVHKIEQILIDENKLISDIQRVILIFRTSPLSLVRKMRELLHIKLLYALFYLFFKLTFSFVSKKILRIFISSKKRLTSRSAFLKSMW